MLTLTLLALTDSFSAMWPVLAEECGLEIVRVSEPARLNGISSTVAVISSGGAEEQLEPVLREIVRGEAGIAVVGAREDHRLAVCVLRAGASEYFSLPGDYDLLRSWVLERAARLRTDADRSSFAAGEGTKYQFDGILGSSDALRKALDRASRVIPHGGVTVLITGETGTGKELVARAIHYNGPRREAPFVDVNCAAIPEQLLESELFGHEKGSFTSATSAKPGLFEVANGGSLFLDEIGHMPLVLQGKLLRALEERTVRRVGGTRTIRCDVRIIAATNAELRGAVKRGEFREDLYFRLNVVQIELPSLRERREDIVPLARHFLRRFAEEYGLPEPTLTPAAERELKSRPWSGNVRELRNAVERALLLGGPALDAADFVPDSARAMPTGSLPFPATLGEITSAAVRETMEMCGGNKSDAARRLRISRPRLQRILDAIANDETDTGEDYE